MNFPPETSYAILVVPFILIWFLFFIFGRKNRREQLIVSILTIPMGPVGELFYLYDYWKPQSILSFNIGFFYIRIEDIVFAFAIGGIGSVVWNIFLDKGFSKISPKGSLKNKVFRVLVAPGIIGITLFFLGLNSIFATSVGFVIASLFILKQRKDLIECSIFSGLGTMLAMFLAYYLLLHVVSNSEELF